MNNLEIGQKLKSIRKARNLKQCDVANKLNLSKSAVCNIESGRRSLTLATLEKFADFYKIDVSTITNEFNTKNEVVDLLERSRKIFENDNIPKEMKEDLYLQLMRMYLNAKNF